MAAKPQRGRRQNAVLDLELTGPAAPAPAAKLPGTAVKRPLGRVESAVGKSITAGRSGAPADPRWAAGEALARELARGVDVAGANADPYALAQLGPKLLDVLRELALTPSSATVKGELAELLADLKTPD